MSRPFRGTPPDVAGALLRPDVIAKLLARFEARVVVVQAGPGFGKTTALTQAVQQNLLAPRGLDIWVGCEPADVAGEHLLAGVADSLDIERGSGIEAVVDAVAARSPTQVCIILDDVHEVPAASSGADAIGALVADLPANGHLVLASRTEPPVSLARLEAQGRVEWLREDDLRLDARDIARLASDAGRDPRDVGHLGGWPALISLGLRSDHVREFLDEELLSFLDDDECTQLSIVVALGGADAPLLQALTARPVNPSLARLPMVHHVDGWFEAHALWREVFPATEIDDVRDRFERAAVEDLLARGLVVRAVDMACRTGQGDVVLNALRRAVLDQGIEDVDVLRRWRDAIPEDALSHPLAHHVSGLVEQAGDPTTAEARDLFHRAAEGFAAMGDKEAAVWAFAEVGFWHHIQRDAAGLVAIAIQMQHLADEGVAAAVPFVDITHAFAGLAQGDPHAMLAAVRRARTARMTGRFAAIADWLEFQALEFMGTSDVDLADRYLAGAGAIRGTEVIAISSRWRAGRIEELIATLDEFGPLSGSERARFLNHAWLAAVTAGVGRLDAARTHLATAQRYAGERGAKQVEITARLPAILIEYEAGNVEEAGAEMGRLLTEIPLAGDTRLSYNGSAGHVARYFPEHIPELAVPLPARDVDVGLALRELDQTGDLAGIESVAWPQSPGIMLSSLFLRASCEFVAAAWAAGRTEARPTAEWLLDVIGDPARERFRDHGSHPVKAVASAAKEILAAVPLPPNDVRRLSLFGSERLLIGAVETDHDDWRRERVRSLLGFLVVHPDSTRDAVMAALWPEASEEAARRNLRSTLNLLLGVLEPTRSGGDASYFIRTDSTRMRLVGHDRLEVDVWEFDASLDAADRLEADGVPSLALERLLAALDLYRGDLFEGIVEGEWLHLERQRLHIRFVGAAVRASELLLAHDRPDEAIKLATRTIKVEPWSEPAHRTLVAGHLQRGDRAAAHRAMERCHEALADLGGPVDESTAMLERRLRV